MTERQYERIVKCESTETSPAGLQSLVVTLEPVPQLDSVVSMSVSGQASEGRLPLAHSCTRHNTHLYTCIAAIHLQLHR